MGSVHLTATEEKIPLPCDQQRKKETKSNAKMMRDYRKRVKADPIKYQKYLEQERLRNNRRKRRKKLNINESAMLNNAVKNIQTQTTSGIQCKTAPLEQSLANDTASTALISPNPCKTEFKTKPSLRVAPVVRNNPVQAALPEQVPLELKKVQITHSLPSDLQQAFNIKIVEPSNVITTVTAKPSSAKRNCVVEPMNTSTTTSISNSKLNTDKPFPQKRPCVVQPSYSNTTAYVNPAEKQNLGPATKPLQSAKYYTSTINKVSTNQPSSPKLLSQDFKITLITLDQVPFRPKIAVIRDRPRKIPAKTGSGYQRVGVSTATSLIESTKSIKIGSRTSDGTHDTDSSQDGDVEDVTPATRLIDLTDDVSDEDSNASIPAFADLTNQRMDVNVITTNTDAQHIGPSNCNPVEEGNKNKLNYLDSFVGFVTQQESETNKQRMVSKGMMWNRYS